MVDGPPFKSWWCADISRKDLPVDLDQTSFGRDQPEMRDSNDGCHNPEGQTMAIDSLSFTK